MGSRTLRSQMRDLGCAVPTITSAGKCYATSREGQILSWVPRETAGHTVAFVFRRSLISCSCRFGVICGNPVWTSCACPDIGREPPHGRRAAGKCWGGVRPGGAFDYLYRDRFKLNSNGNWHLVCLTPPFSRTKRREEIVFSIPQEPSDPDSSRVWDAFASELLLSYDGNRAYATFHGAAVTARPGPPKERSVRNVPVIEFSSALSFDLSKFQLTASSDVTPLGGYSDRHRVDSDGDLIYLGATDKAWSMTALDESLHQKRSNDPQGGDFRV